jgi:23S rRNA (cytosine1962-C5)-methyltransferase
MYPIITLKKDKEKSLQRRHPWIFSGAIFPPSHPLEDGTVVYVSDISKNIIATGHFFNGNIAIKILAFEKVAINVQFWEKSIDNAFQLRIKLGLPNSSTNCYRLIHGEGDGLPGLISDVYADVCVLQAHSIGMYKALPQIVTAIQKTIPSIKHIYSKSKETLPEQFASTVTNSFLLGNIAEVIVKENNIQFSIPLAEGQKTGFFLDQRSHRLLLQKYCRNQSVLNTFCYTGGFSLYAMNGGALTVHSTDISAKAIAALEHNISLNSFTVEHQSFTDDTLQYLKKSASTYDIVILDPPAYAKSIQKRHKAVIGYKNLNVQGIKSVAKGGLLFTFSCSQVIDMELFTHTVTAAAIECGRNIRILHQLTQPADHPVSIFHPEGRYLKGLVLYID